MRCACHVIIGYLHTVCSDGNSAETETHRRIALRGTPSGGNYYRRIFPTRAICLPPLIILGGRDLSKIAPKWLVTSESNGINDCCAGIVDEIAQLCVQYQCVQILNAQLSDIQLINQSLLLSFSFSTRFTAFSLDLL